MTSLRALEFVDCIADSPWHRENLRAHEHSLTNAYEQVKNIEQQCRQLVTAAQSELWPNQLCLFTAPTIAAGSNFRRCVRSSRLRKHTDSGSHR